MPPRYPSGISRQVAPTPSTYWRSPDLRDYTRVLKSTERSRHRSEQALRAARADRSRATRESRDAGGVGGGPPGRARRRARGERILSGARDLGSRRLQERRSRHPEEPSSPTASSASSCAQAVPALNLRWLLLDFGRRGSAWDAAKERLLAANLGFNRKHQQIAFARAARVLRPHQHPRPDRRRAELARRRPDGAGRDGEAARQTGSPRAPSSPRRGSRRPRPCSSWRTCSTKERDAQVTLAESIGITPTTPIQVTDFSALPPPADSKIPSRRRSIARSRSDPTSSPGSRRSARPRPRCSRARAAYWPTLSLVGDVGSILGNARVTADGKSTGWFGATQPSYGIGLALEWEVFDGGARRRRVELAESARRAAQDEITATRDRAISEVWKAYTDVKLAFRRLDVAAALLDASQQSYEDSLKSYRVGLGTLTDLLAARRELSRARFVELDTKVQLLESVGGPRVHDGRHLRTPARRQIDRETAVGPQINIVGSFFPSWMLCAAIGIGVAVARATALPARRRGPLSRPASARLPEPRAARHPRALGGAVQESSPMAQRRRAPRSRTHGVSWGGCSAR